MMDSHDKSLVKHYPVKDKQPPHFPPARPWLRTRPLAGFPALTSFAPRVPQLCAFAFQSHPGRSRLGSITTSAPPHRPSEPLIVSWLAEAGSAAPSATPTNSTCHAERFQVSQRYKCIYINKYIYIYIYIYLSVYLSMSMSISISIYI